MAPPAEILRRLEPLIKETARLARSFAWGNLVRNGFSLAIVGLPNAGKSSLFNRLLEQDRAIVTAIAGTTRDLVSESTEFEGIPVRISDTAGIREGAELVERLGIERSFEAMADADLTIVVVDGTLPRSAADRDLVARAGTQGPCLIVANKSDLPEFRAESNEIPVSAATGEGIPELRKSVLESLAPVARNEVEGAFITSARQAGLLREALQMLEKTADAAREALPHELLLLDLYCVLQPLDAMTGATTADDILNRIFTSFCIGK